MEELVHAPSWILATPLYWYSVSAQAKTFLDRLSDLLVFRKDLGQALRGRCFAVVFRGRSPWRLSRRRPACPRQSGTTAVASIHIFARVACVSTSISKRVQDLQVPQLLACIAAP